MLCNYLANLMEKGEMTADENFVGEVVRDICYGNAVKYFGV
ncbi:MAG: glucuronate isomerase [Clostridia bacterium]|nr:glucuronate isomerase [Clostridia bacterium]